VRRWILIAMKKAAVARSGDQVQQIVRHEEHSSREKGFDNFSEAATNQRPNTVRARLFTVVVDPRSTALRCKTIRDTPPS
jgi:phosphopentomutase